MLVHDATDHFLKLTVAFVRNWFERAIEYARTEFVLFLTVQKREYASQILAPITTLDCPEGGGRVQHLFTFLFNRLARIGDCERMIEPLTESGHQRIFHLFYLLRLTADQQTSKHEVCIRE